MTDEVISKLPETLKENICTLKKGEKQRAKTPKTVDTQGFFDV